LVHYIFLYKLPTDLKLENLVFKIRFLNTQTEKKYAKAVQKHCQKLAYSILLSILHTVLRFGVPFTFQLLLSSRNLTPSLGIDLKLLPLMNIYMQHMWYISYYSNKDCGVSLTIVSIQLLVLHMSRAANGMAKYVRPNSILKQKFFCTCLAWPALH